MTLDRCVELLRELRALERMRAALALHGTDPDWQYTLTVLGNRVFLLRASLSIEPPALLSAALDVLEDERRTFRDTQVSITDHHESPRATPAPVASRRIH